MPKRPILVVDDEPANLAVMRQILSDDHQLVFARSGADALAAAVKHRPSLILLDIQMADIDGYDVCRQLKADPALEETPVIFITALAEIGNEAEGFAAGAVDYITKPVSPPILQARINTHLSLVKASQLEKSYRDAVYMLGSAGHYNDNDTGVHIWRMAAYSAALATASGWASDASRVLELAAPMHDTGKIGIPDSILRKPAKLDADEWVIMRAHAQMGHDILINSSAPVFQLAAEVALRHHEKWDGSGYPSGLKGTEIPESGRIVAIADVFDALSMKRPYKEAWPLERIVETLQLDSGTHFDPRLTELFVKILPQILEIKQSWDARE